MRLCPLHAVPLQQVIRHEVTVLVGGCAIHIPAPTAKTQDNNTRDSRPLIFGEEESCTVSFAVQAHHILVVVLIVDEELVALTGCLVNSVKSIKIGLSLSPAYCDTFSCR